MTSRWGGLGEASAIASITPNKFPNRERLSGSGLFERLGQAVLRRIEPEWDRLDVIDRFGETIESFEKEYEVTAVEINSHHDSDFGTPWDTKPRPEQNLHIVLKRKNFPKGFALKAILPIENGQIQNIELFQKDIDSYLRLVNSVPWVKEFIDSGKAEVWLRFVKDRSFSKKGMRSFTADMKTLGKEKLAAEVDKVQDKIALLSIGGGLEYYQSFWLVLPDETSILWRHYYVSPLPGISFTGVECAENRSNTKPCVGAKISRKGKEIVD